MSKIIEFNNVTLAYNKDKIILKNINFNIEEKEMVAIVGPSGIGKSTIFKCIVKSLKPLLGQIKIFEKNINSIKHFEWKKIINQIGFLTQKPNLINTDNVYENIKRSFTQYKNWFYKILNILTLKQKEHIFATLDELGILNKAFYRISDLSGGQQQRVEIAKLLVKETKLILADEPTSNLDFETSNEVLDILRDLNQKLNITILINIHDIDLALKKFDRVIVLNEQRIVLDKPTKNVEKWEIIKLIKK